MNFLAFFWGLFCPQMSFAQANLVMNPSFEAYSPCATNDIRLYDPNFYWFMPWHTQNTHYKKTSLSGKHYVWQKCNIGASSTFPNVHNYYSSQNPRTGNAISGLELASKDTMYYYDTTQNQFFVLANPPIVSNLNGVLKSSLEQNKNYCVTVWWSSVKSQYAADNFGIFFHHGEYDSIDCPMMRIPVTPQIQWNGGIMMDTVYWNKFSGVVTGNGETRIMLSGFKAFEDINFVVLEPVNYLNFRAAYYIDDVSVIPQDLPAWAGNDSLVYPYDSVWVGRPWEVGLDENQWVEITANGDSALALGAGIWQQFSPGTHTLVVRQDLCGVVTRDTVVITADQTASRAIPWQKHISIGPNPSTGSVFVQTSEPIQIKVYDLSGKCILEKNIQNPTEISLKNWSSGLYLFECTAAGKPGIFSQKIIKE